MALCFGEKPQKKKKKKFSESSMSNLVHSNNLKHITPMHKKRNWSATKADIDKEKIKEKMLELLIDCHDVGSK